MILFFGDGQLGNQIFQYAFINSVVTKKQAIVTVKFKEFINLFAGDFCIKNIENRYVIKIIRLIIVPILEMLAQVRVISSCSITKKQLRGYAIEGDSYHRRCGVFPITYIKACYAQSERHFTKYSLKELRIKDNYLESAKAFIESIPNNTQAIFVHIRRGDYINFSVLGIKNATLPVNYYWSQINWFIDNLDNPYFIFLTDDPEFVDRSFSGLKNKIISKNDMYIDFSIMTLCRYGILSNSSFSWWGGYFMNNRNKLFAPRYWLGWKSEIEYQSGIHPSFAELVDVSKR